MDAGTKRGRDIGAKGHRDEEGQGCQGKGMERCGDAGMYEGRDVGMQGCRDKGMQGRKGAGMEGCGDMEGSDQALTDPSPGCSRPCGGAGRWQQRPSAGPGRGGRMRRGVSPREGAGRGLRGHPRRSAALPPA